MTDASLWHEAACYAVTVYQTSTGGFEQQYCAAEAVVAPSGSPKLTQPQKPNHLIFRRVNERVLIKHMG